MIFRGFCDLFVIITGIQIESVIEKIYFSELNIDAAG
jgi:hypothetical protein